MSTEIGPINVGVLDSVISFFCKEALLPGINRAIAKGLPLPTVDGVEFVNSAVKFDSGYVLIDTDVKYNPPSYM